MDEFELSLIEPQDNNYNPLEQEEDNTPISTEVEKPEVFNIGDNFEVSTVEVDPEEEDENEEPGKDKPKPEERKPKETSNKAPKNKQEEDAAFYTSLAATLKEWDIIEEFTEEEFDGSLDSLKELMNKKSEAYHQKKLDELAKNLNPIERQKLGLAAEGLQADDLQEALEELEQLKSIDAVEIESNLDLAKSLYRERLIRSGFSKEKADRYVKMAEDANTLTEEAFDSKEFLEADAQKTVDSKKTEAAAKKEEAKARQLEREEKIKKAVFDPEEFIPGVKVNSKLKEKIYESINKQVATTPDGRPLNSIGALSMSNPAEFQALLHYYKTLGLFNQNDKGQFTPDLSALQKAVSTKVVEKISRESDLRRMSFAQYNTGPDAEAEESLLERIRREKSKQKT
jgi:hypothetical protein